MTTYSDLSTPELIDHALNAFKTPNLVSSRMVHALTKRLTREYARANRHHDKLTEVAKDYVHKSRRIHTLEARLAHLERSLNTNRPGPGYIKVAKPHINRVEAFGPGDRHIWKCSGACGVRAYGKSPAHAYQQWLKILARPYPRFDK